MSTPNRLSPRAQRGSILVVAMLFGTLLTIALTTYVALNTHSLKMANRSFFATEAMNMAEAGIEEAMWSFNQAQAGDTTAWNGWAKTGDTATRTFNDFLLGANCTGTVKVYVSHYNPSGSVQPIVVAQSTVTLPGNQGTISKYLETKMRRRTYFAGGIVAKNSVRFSGNNASVDSWNSNPDKDPSTPPIAYSTTIRRDKGSVAGASVTSTIDVENADIWGTAAVGGGSTAAITVGPQGRVGKFGTGAGVKDPANLATDFITNLNDVTLPAGGTIIASVPATLGTAGTTTVWRTPTLSSSLTIEGDVTLILTASAGTSAIDITGSKGITLAANATLTIYTAGDIRVAGNGVLNPNAQPETFQIWGTSTSSVAQSIDITGNGALKGIVYAPNGDIKISGNGDVMGAMVGKNVHIAGNAAFHYDEALADWGSNTPYGIYNWRELVTPSDRNAYAAHLTF